jgi:hypothetical protein
MSIAAICPSRTVNPSTENTRPARDTTSPTAPFTSAG